MEPSEPLSIESFSYSWLVNLKPSFETPKGSFRGSFDISDESNFIEMDPKLSASKRFLVFHQDFDFDLPALQPAVHADELISNGVLVPLILKRPCDLAPAKPSPEEHACLYRRSQSSSFRRYKRLPKSVVKKYLSLFRFLWLRMRRRRRESGGGGSGGGGKVKAFSGDEWQRSCDEEMFKSWRCSGVLSPASEAGAADNWRGSWVELSGGLSPRMSEAAFGVDSWRRSCDSESSIYEAVLHCKKTIGCE